MKKTVGNFQELVSGIGGSNTSHNEALVVHLCTQRAPQKKKRPEWKGQAYNKQDIRHQLFNIPQHLP
jgi:hypothetical protein